MVQAKLLACCYGFMSEFVTSVGRHYSALIQYETNSQQLLQESGRCNLREKNFASRPYMYFSEKGNVDDEATLMMIFLVSFNLQSCCLMQSAVCSLQSAVCGLQSAVCKCHTPCLGDVLPLKRELRSHESKQVSPNARRGNF